MAESEKAVPLAISLPESLIAEIDRVAESTKQSRSAVMRRAIRDGLLGASSGGNADVVCLDSELSKDVDDVSKEAQLSRAKVILESVRTGLRAFSNRVLREQVTHAHDHSPEDAERVLAIMEQLHFSDDPMARELRTSLRQRGAAVIRFHDLLMHVPEAWRRYKLVERLSESRKQPTGPGGGAVWGTGLSTDEIEWQLAMAQKYGVGGLVPDHEIKAREEARKLEDRSQINAVQDELLTKPLPEK